MLPRNFARVVSLKFSVSTAAVLYMFKYPARVCASRGYVIGAGVYLYYVCRIHTVPPFQTLAVDFASKL